MGWTDEEPRHFLDMDSYGPFPFKDLPHDYNAAVATRGADFVKKNGVRAVADAGDLRQAPRRASSQLPTAPLRARQREALRRR